MKRTVLSCAALLATLIMAAPLRAQELTTGTISGKVSDPTGRGIAGAVIIATSQFGTRTAETDAGGLFILPFLRPGTYAVRAEASGGFTTVIRNDVVVGLNQKTSIDFTLEPGKTETITVTGQAPLVDVTSTATSTNLKYDDFANSVPLGRSFTDTYAVAAGVVSGLGTGTGNYAIGGASGLENAYLIDGVNITNTGYGGIGSYNINYGSLGTGVTSEFLDEVQIKTAGFEAEYGQALGGIINTIVKSGTNDFKGSVSWYSSPSALQSSRELVKLDAGAANRLNEDVQDFAFSVGGPFIKDKLFYFFAYNPVLTTHTVAAQSLFDPAYTAAQAGVPVFDESGPTGFSAPNALVFPTAGESFDRKRTANNYAGKINWQISPKHQLEFSFFGDPATGAAGPQRGNAVLSGDYDLGGGQSNIRYGSDNQMLRWNAVFSPRFFMEAQISHHAGVFRETSTLDQYNYVDLRNTLEYFRGANSYDPGGGPVPLELSPVAAVRGGVGFIQNQDDTNTSYSLKFTQVFGKHELKYGAQYDDISYQDNPTYSGPSFNIQLPVSDPNTGAPVDADLDGVQDTVAVPTRGGALVNVRNGIGTDVSVAYDSANRFRVVRAQLGPKLPANHSTDEALFAQDTWQIVPGVTLKAGVRFSEETVEGSGTFTLPFGTQNITLGGVTNRIFTPGTSTYTPSSYTFSGNIAPRLGVTWDVLGNGKSRAYANWGRYYQRIPNDLALRAFSNEVGVSRQEFSDRALTTPRVAGPIGGCSDGLGGSTACSPLAGGVFLQGVDKTSVVDGTKLPYEDEISAGFAFEVTPNSSFEIRTIYRTQGRALEDVQVNAIESIQNFYYGYSYGYPYDPFGGSTGTPQSTKYPAATFGSYQLANPGTKNVPAGAAFPKPERRYKALELVYTKRLSDNWSVYANYRFSRLMGNYEGLFRNDNGQSDPNITSLYDFPNSPLMSGQFNSGPLPTDVSHVLHVYPSYQFNNKLRVGANFSWASGVPRTSMLAHPIYQNSGEIPGINPVYAYWADPGNSGNPANFVLRKTTSLGAALADPESGPFGGGPFLFSYDPVKRGNLGRTPDTVTLDLHGDYPLNVGKSKVTFMVDVFNVFGSQEATLFDDNIELTAGVTDPDFLKPIQYQAPRNWRLAARWDF